MESVTTNAMTVSPVESAQAIDISELSLGDEFKIGHMNAAEAFDSKEGYQALVAHVQGVLLSDEPEEVKKKLKRELVTIVAAITKWAKDIQDRRAWLDEETQKLNQETQKLNDLDKKGLPRLMRGTMVLGESMPTQPACLLRRPPRVTRRPRYLPSLS